MKIQTHELTKSYLVKTALDKVSTVFDTGKIHALVGENGAGKSTLATILSGDKQPTSGKIFIDGREVYFSSAHDALGEGIVLVHQRPMLAESLSAKENIILNLQTTKSKSFFIHKPSAELLKLKEKWVPELNLNSCVKDLGGNMRFYISLLGSLLRHPKCLILDEPSAFLSSPERQVLYKNLRECAQNGMNIIVITHSKAEATTYPDTVTLLKDGSLVRQFESHDTYKDFLQSSHIQPQEESTQSAINGSGNSVCFEFKNVSARPKNKPLLLQADITACYGQITAVTGVKEAALETLEDIITGINPYYAKGTAAFTDRDGKTHCVNLARAAFTTGFLRKHGTAIVPSDKTFRASNPDITIEQMLTIYQKNCAADLIAKACVNAAPNQYVKALSGGMLQRLIVEREISLNPNLIILCNPMHGLDIQSQSRLCKRLVALAQDQKAVLLIGAADFPLSLCSKVYTLESGRTHLEFCAGEQI